MALEIVFVSVSVLPKGVPAFIAVTTVNAEASRKEPGVVRFDVIVDQVDPNRFVLIEIYRDNAAVIAHKETAHYKLWRDVVAPLMAEPRTSRKFHNVSPSDTTF